MKYIDEGKLIAEIESRMEDCKLPNGKFPTTTNVVRYEELSCLRNLIAFLEQEQPEVFDTIAFQKGVREGKRLAVETIQSRIGEILGDAQPAPILRLELQELIKNIEQ